VPGENPPVKVLSRPFHLHTAAAVGNSRAISFFPASKPRQLSRNIRYMPRMGSSGLKWRNRRRNITDCSGSIGQNRSTSPRLQEDLGSWHLSSAQPRRVYVDHHDSKSAICAETSNTILQTLYDHDAGFRQRIRMRGPCDNIRWADPMPFHTSYLKKEPRYMINR
jgi:hypothetical protein